MFTYIYIPWCTCDAGTDIVSSICIHMYSYIFYMYTCVFICLPKYIYLGAHATPAPTSHLPTR